MKVILILLTDFWTLKEILQIKGIFRCDSRRIQRVWSLFYAMIAPIEVEAHYSPSLETWQKEINLTNYAFETGSAIFVPYIYPTL